MQDVSSEASEAEMLNRVFQEVNTKYFEGFLDQPVLRWNARLRSSAGRFIPGSRKWFAKHPAVIEVASYLLDEKQAQEFVRDTIAHEMIHYWLWLRRKPYGHTPEFYSKMKLMGVSRYNPVPRSRPFKYVYCCAFCQKEFYAKKRLPALACADCCKIYSGGRYDDRFRLILVRTLEKGAPAPVKPIPE